METVTTTGSDRFTELIAHQTAQWDSKFVLCKSYDGLRDTIKLMGELGKEKLVHCLIENEMRLLHPNLIRILNRYNITDKVFKIVKQ